MKFFNFFIALALIIATGCHPKTAAIDPVKVVDPATNEAPKKEYAYTTVPDDPMNSRVYTLENGLTVMLTAYKDAPRIYTNIAVKTGSKNDPQDATGLAHYLEHMLFKGTKQFGTTDYEKEKPYLDEIEALYEVYRKTTDPAERKAIYAQIDSVSNIASGIAIANEYDKMLMQIGAKGTNAYTWLDQTVYINDIPSNQLENWLTIESDRFQNPVLRIFHTELEAVYEEKNRSLDSDYDQVWEAVFEGLFPNHTYGTQTTIGTIDHLKNPSITKIKEYLNTYYVPNNIAICLSGDLDPDETIRMIDEKFGAWERKEVPERTYEPCPEITAPIVKEVFGPEAEGIIFGYRFPAAKSLDTDYMRMIDMILSNSMAGLIDINLNKSQKVLSAGSFTMTFGEYSTHLFSGEPKEGQSLEEVRDLILAQLKKIKAGEFDESLIPAIINDFKLSEIKSLEKNSVRSEKFVESFINEIPLEQHLKAVDRMSKLTKEQIVEFANKYYNDNYVIVYKRKGERDIQKVEKPAITPIQVNRDAQSDFLKKVFGNEPDQIAPAFVDFNRAIQFDELKKGIKLQYVKNTENPTFYYSLMIQQGKYNDKFLPLAAEYLPYLGTSKYSNEDIQKKFYGLGCSYRVKVEDEKTYITLSGLSENFERALVLLEDLLNNAAPDQAVLEQMIGDVLKRRADAKSERRTILWGGMFNYAKYGAKNPFTDVVSEEELKALKAEDLINKIHTLKGYQQTLQFYGSVSKEDVISKFNLHHKTAENLIISKTKSAYPRQDLKEKKVYIIDYDMQQAEVVLITKGNEYNADNEPMVRLYNDYFGGGMSGLVFQDMRESKALAYSVYSVYDTPEKATDPYYNFAYIGTQADKLKDAMEGMMSLLTDMPLEQKNFDMAKTAILSKIRTERITKFNILRTYSRNQELGIENDIRQMVYNRVGDITLEELSLFQRANIANENYVVLVLGDKNKLDLEVLKQYGEIEYLDMKTIFGY